MEESAELSLGAQVVDNAIEVDPARAVPGPSGRWRRRGRLTLLCSVVVVTSLAVLVPLALRSPPASTRPSSNTPVALPPLLWRELWNLSQGLASGDGDPNAYGREAVGPVSEQLAVKVVSGDGDSSTTPSYVIEIKGRFTCGGCSVPFGAHAPSGTVISDFLSASTLLGNGFGLSSRWVQLTGLGRPIILPRPPHGLLWPMPPSHVAHFTGTWSAPRAGAVMTLRGMGDGQGSISSIRWIPKHPLPHRRAAFIDFDIDEMRTGNELPSEATGSVTSDNVGLPTAGGGSTQIFLRGDGYDVIVSTSAAPKTPLPGPFCQRVGSAMTCT
jgi:hypothetical protein